MIGKQGSRKQRSHRRAIGDGKRRMSDPLRQAAQISTGSIEQQVSRTVSSVEERLNLIVGHRQLLGRAIALWNIIFVEC